ncbi:MAG: hypothetical protein QNJ77_13625 [Acidimicrobiia bacterium]|nr:hypothetical protein [Acidimicrobiia bacterium]
MVDTTQGSSWAPTHRAPPEGLDAWASPDAAAPPTGDLEGGVELQLVEQAGAWVRVVGENRWEGWVDGRLLEQVDPSGKNSDQAAYVLLGVALVVLAVLAILALGGGS